MMSVSGASQRDDDATINKNINGAVYFAGHGC